MKLRNLAYSKGEEILNKKNLNSIDYNINRELNVFELLKKNLFYWLSPFELSFLMLSKRGRVIIEYMLELN